MDRRRPLSLLLLPVALLLAATAVLSPVRAESSARAGLPAGKAGTTVTLRDGVLLQSWDALVDDSGDTYIAWIDAPSNNAADRRVRLCRMPKDSSTCTTSEITLGSSWGGSSADGIKVLQVLGEVVVLWYHNSSDNSVGKISQSTVTGSGTLGAQNVVADAPAFGGMYDAAVSPEGYIAAVTWASSGSTIQAHRIDPFQAPTQVALNPSFDVGQARIAFHGTQGVMVLDKLGGFSDPVKVMSQRADDSWRSPTNVPGNWSLQGAWDLASTDGGSVRLVTSVPRASYYPQIAAWGGADSFRGWTLTGYKGACQFTTHDLYADPSGRLADAFHACGQVRIFNHPTAGTAAMSGFADARTPVTGSSFSDNGPQIATSPRGTGWLVWAVNDPDTELLATRVRLPGKVRTARKSTTYGTVTLRGPVSCQPASDLGVGVSATGRNGWSILSKQMLLDGNAQGGTLDGAALSPGSTHSLVGTVRYRKNGQTRSVSVTIGFSACAGPSAF